MSKGSAKTKTKTITVNNNNSNNNNNNGHNIKVGGWDRGKALLPCLRDMITHLNNVAKMFCFLIIL